MDHIITFSLGVMIIILTRKLYFYHFELFLCALIVINFEFFYLVPRFGKYPVYQEILLPITLFYLIEEVFIYKVVNPSDSSHLHMGEFKIWILCFFIITALGVLVAMKAGQPLILGIKAVKYRLLVTIYFIAVFRGIDEEKFTQYFIYLALGISALVLLQYFLMDYWIFFNIYDDTNVLRLLETRGRRLLIGTGLTAIASVMSLAVYFKNGERRNLFYWFFLISALFIFSKSRYLLFGTVSAALFLFFCHKQYSRKLLESLPYIGLVLTIVLGAYIYRPFAVRGFPFIEHTVKDAQIAMKSRDPLAGSISTRMFIYDYYLKEFWNRPIVGRGIFNRNWKGNIDDTVQKNYGFYLTDIGIMQFFIESGLIGVVWFSVGMTMLFRRIILAKDDLIIPSYFIIGMLLLPAQNILIYSDYLFLFGIFLALLTLKNDPASRNSRVVYQNY